MISRDRDGDQQHPRAVPPAKELSRPAAAIIGNTRRSPREELSLTLEDVQYPAYMFNYQLELTWYNEAARENLLGGFARVPADGESRNILSMLRLGTARWDESRSNEVLRSHLAIAKTRLTRGDVMAGLRHVSHEEQNLFLSLYDETEPVDASNTAAVVVSLQLRLDESSAERFDLICTYFREGVLAVCAPATETTGSLAEFLSRRDIVIHQLLRKQLPVLTPVSVLIADLQGSTKICSELPPEEYFELINEIWATMEPIFRDCHGTRGKHVGDGMLYYFFPQPDSSYLFNSVCAANQLRDMMRQLSAKWQARKGWFVELHLNIGLHEGTEWLGTFNAENSIEVTVLGDTINQAARVSELARFGAIWVTKDMIGKLATDERARLSYGVKRRGPEGREVFVDKSFAQIESLVDLDSNTKMREVAMLPVTEIVAVR